MEIKDSFLREITDLLENARKQAKTAVNISMVYQDIGQMQMYVNYYDRRVKLAEENPTIGIVLCKDKNDAVVEMTLPEDNTQIFASKYETVLPSKEDLKRLLNEGLDPFYSEKL